MVAPLETESRVGNWGWTALAAGVIVWDVVASETLSSAYDRYLQHPVKRVVAVGAVALTAAHLLNCLPKQYDPFDKALNGLGKIFKEL